MNGTPHKRFKKSTLTRNRIIPCEEQGAKILFENPQEQQYEYVHVDDDEIIEGKRCDYLLIRDCPAEEYFVELKGSRIQDGFEQLKSTISRLGLKNLDVKRLAFIITTSRVTKINSMIQIQKHSFKKNYNTNLYVQKSGYSYKLNVNVR